MISALKEKILKFLPKVGYYISSDSVYDEKSKKKLSETLSEPKSDYIDIPVTGNIIDVSFFQKNLLIKLQDDTIDLILQHCEIINVDGINYLIVPPNIRLICLCTYNGSNALGTIKKYINVPGGIVKNFNVLGYPIGYNKVLNLVYFESNNETYNGVYYADVNACLYIPLPVSIAASSGSLTVTGVNPAELEMLAFLVGDNNNIVLGKFIIDVLNDVYVIKSIDNYGYNTNDGKLKITLTLEPVNCINAAQNKQYTLTF